MVDGVLVGREEVRPAALLMGVDEEHARVLVHERHEEAVLLLVLRPEVAVGVKAPGRRARDRVMAVRVADRHQEHVQDLHAVSVLAVGPREQLVDLARERLARGGLVAVRRGRAPREGGPRAGGVKTVLRGDGALTHAAPERRRRWRRRRGWRCSAACRRRRSCTACRWPTCR